MRTAFATAGLVAVTALAGCSDFETPPVDARQPMAAVMAQCAKAESGALRLSDEAMNKGGDTEAALAALAQAKLVCATAADELSRLVLPEEASKAHCVVYLQSKGAPLDALSAWVRSPSATTKATARAKIKASMRLSERCSGKLAT